MNKLANITVQDVPVDPKDIKIEELERELMNVKQELANYKQMYLDALENIRTLEVNNDTRYNSEDDKS